ncbi:serine hydrolase [Phytohabitans rumicis]|uniref:serine hydrolase n=1 Tax=Phytohabitans rumicis TaxID=1076125 RepID=UPI001564C3FC|nr:serine hydrolase [Phytohabitans rumicis]
MTAVVVLGTVAASAGASAYATTTTSAVASGSRDDVSIAEYLRQTMDGLGFQEVVDLAPPATAQFNTLNADVDADATTAEQRARQYAAVAAVPQPIVQQPQIDASVLELDDAGRIVSSGTVLMSPQYPHGVVVPVDANHHTTAVRYRQWDTAGWYANHGQGTIDVVPARESAPLDFMSPYPASVLKLMVNFGILRLVDQGVVGLDDTYSYQPETISSLCGPASSNTIRAYVDASLTASSNAATCALIKLLWDYNAMDGLNQAFQDLGLETLQLAGTRPSNGGNWSNAITMSSLDTAKLLVLINGAPGTLWTTPAGVPVTASSALSASSRQLFAAELGQQGWNWMLSTTNFCGRGYPAPGIPQVTADRWIAADGTVTVDGNRFGQDVRPCDQAAQVSFAHKPGWTTNAGADAGIVKSLPGKPHRQYVITVFSNLGDRYQDPQRPATPTGVVPVEYTQKFAQLGAAIDQYEVRRCATL